MADNAIAKAKKFCEDMKVEKELRDVIAGITAKLQRSNLSVEEGLRHANSLVKAYKLLEDIEKGLKNSEA